MWLTLSFVILAELCTLQPLYQTCVSLSFFQYCWTEDRSGTEQILDRRNWSREFLPCWAWWYYLEEHKPAKHQTWNCLHWHGGVCSPVTTTGLREMTGFMFWLWTFLWPQSKLLHSFRSLCPCKQWGTLGIVELHALVSYSSGAISCTNPQILLPDLAPSVSCLESKPGSLLCHMMPEAVMQGCLPWHQKPEQAHPYQVQFTRELV